MIAVNGCMQIGEVSKRLGITPRTLRFYEQQGLVNPSVRTGGGFRLYSEDDVRRVEHILQLRKLLGVSLSEIKEMVEAEGMKAELLGESQDRKASEATQPRLRKATAVIEKQVAIIDTKMEQLSRVRAEWHSKLKRYRDVLRQAEEDLTARSTSSPR